MKKWIAIFLSILPTIGFVSTVIENGLIIVAVIWLLFEKQWWVIGKGFLLLFLSKHVLTFACLPLLFIIAGLARTKEIKVKFIEAMLSFLMFIYLLSIVTGINLGVIYLLYLEASEKTLVPILIFSYAVVAGIMGDIVYEMKQDGKLSLSETVMFYYCKKITCLALLVSIFLRSKFISFAKLYIGLSLIYIPIGMIIMYWIERKLSDNRGKQTNQIGLGDV